MVKLANKNFNEELDLLNSSSDLEAIGAQLKRLSKELSAKQQILFINTMKLRIEKVLSLRLEVIKMCQTV